MKYETINGTLFCRIVEPEPLTPEATFPCVVRLIQDDSPMGLCNRWKYSEKQDFLKKDWTISSLENNLNKVKDIHYSQFEIIGYPVVDGSAEWALWQMKQGKKVYHKSYTLKTTHCAINDESQVVIFTTPYSVANGGDVVCHADEWLDHLPYCCGVDERTGWHLYEPQPKPKPKPKPKPLLADAKVGDLCQRRDGKWVQIVKVDDYQPSGWKHNHPIHGSDYGFVRQLNGKLDAREINSDGHLDIIHTEPLAPEGTAEWAWQMLKLGKPVTNKLFIAGGHIKDTDSDKYHFVKMWGYSGWQLYEEKPETAKEPEIVAHKQHANCLVCGKVIEGLLDGHATVSIKRYSISSLYESTYSHYCGKCFLELGFDATERELRNRQQPIAEPVKEQFKVGDWAKYDIDSYLRVIETPGREKTLCKTLSGVIVYPYTSCLTKVSPSEVVVHIGCLKGTVAPGCSDATIMIVPIGYNGFGDVAIIPVAMLDAPTRKLVKALLKAQGGAE